MKTLGLTPLAAALLLVSSLTVSYAQGSDVAPDQKGATGWSGGARDQPSQPGGDKAAETSGQKIEVHEPSVDETVLILKGLKVHYEQRGMPLYEMVDATFDRVPQWNNHCNLKRSEFGSESFYLLPSRMTWLRVGYAWR